MSSVWGVHNDTLTTELVDEGFVSIGWDQLDDLTTLPPGRDGLKTVLTAEYPERKPGAIATWAGTLMRFRDDMKPGDIVVAPYKPDSTINIGIIEGPYTYVADAPTHRHRRPVTWKKTGVSRTVFTQSALYELGAFLTVFGIRRHAAEFRAVLETTDDSVEDVTRLVEAVAETASSDGDTTDEPRASRIERHTRDFVLETLHKRLTHAEFEEFTADLLRALGYQARVTAYSQDGGVDVIAHRDPLGVEPPLIKVQCKHHTGTVGAPEVQQLIGTQGHNELSSSPWVPTVAMRSASSAHAAGCACSPARTSSPWPSSTTTHSPSDGVPGSRSRRCSSSTTPQTAEVSAHEPPGRQWRCQWPMTGCRPTYPEEDLMAQITVLTKDDIVVRRRDLLNEAGLTLDELHERAASYLLSPEQSLILKELDDLEFLARA